jgi:hypothetical protein
LAIAGGGPDPDSPESEHEEKRFRETVLPSGKIEAETEQGRADAGDVPTAETLGTLARVESLKTSSRSSNQGFRQLARYIQYIAVRHNDKDHDSGE